ncbi:hypothetical protein [Microtetraspora sp. NBRC 13810]|uniref:hypothetical protein n=1 Tax=Microtetraspora sp. NBRC 13810 TaxID=3030990 RepID=UPI00255458E4|nr:hypothetical protein [Microtetraspora sp. NBRC 13810]
MSRWWWLSVLTTLLGTFLLAGAPATAATAAPGGADVKPVRVALIGVPGLEWSDVNRTRTPNLWRMVDQGGSAAMSTRTIPPPERAITCPVAGWLTVSAGQRAGAPGAGCGLPPLPERAAEGAVVPGWDNLMTFNDAQSYGTAIGSLGDLVTASGGKVAAIGPGAALGAADKSGKIAKYAGTTEALGDLTPYNLIVMEIDNLAKAWIGAGVDATGAPIPPSTRVRQRAAADSDRRVGTLLRQLPPDTTVLVAGLSDGSTDPHLHVALATGKSPSGRPYPRGYLTSTSTRQNALVTLPDLTSTAISLLGLPQPAGVVGRTWEYAGPAPATAGAVADLADADLASQVLREVRAPFFSMLVIVQVVFYLLAAVAVRRRWGGSRVLFATEVVAVGSGAIAVSTFLAQLVPWWSTGSAMVTLLLTILGFAGLITAAAFAGPWRRTVYGPLTVVAAVTSIAMLLDVMTGSRLQVNAVGGYEPVTGGRFYGFGNIAFAVFATGTVMFLSGVAQPLLERGRKVLAVAICAAYGAFAVFANGWPLWGADFGGVLAFVPGVAVFLLLLSGKKVSAFRLFLVGVGAVVIIGLITFADWTRPVDQRTHLGDFFQQVLDGDALPVVGRKLEAMIGTLGNLPLTILSLVALAFLFLVLARPSRWGASALSLAYQRAPSLRAGLFGALTCALVGFLVNDSGIAIPAMALTIAVPLTLAASVQALRLSARDEPGAAPIPPARSSARAGSKAPHAP